MTSAATSELIAQIFISDHNADPKELVTGVLIFV